MKKAYDLTQSEIDGHHELYDLAREAGHASLKSYLNDRDAWDEDLDKIKADLIEEINTPAE